MLDINDITLRFGGRLLFNAASAHISDGQKVGLTGRNGTGKTTLFRLICGDLSPDDGDIGMTKGHKIATVAQEIPDTDISLTDCVLQADTQRTALLAELEKAELAERVRSGFSKPSHILLKVPHTVQNCVVTVCISAQSDCAETHSIVAQKCTPNQRNKNNLKDNHLIGANNARLSLGEYQNVFLTEKEYKRLV